MICAVSGVYLWTDAVKEKKKREFLVCKYWSIWHCAAFCSLNPRLGSPPKATPGATLGSCVQRFTCRWSVKNVSLWSQPSFLNVGFKVGQLLSQYLVKSWSHFLFIFRVFYSKLQRSLQSLEKASHWKWLCPVPFSASNHWSDNWYLLGSGPSKTGMESWERQKSHHVSLVK